MKGKPMPNRSKRASAVGPRAQAACDRACAGYAQVIELADKVSEDIDQITMPGVPVELDEDDSMVTSLEAIVIDHQLAAAKG